MAKLPRLLDSSSGVIGILAGAGRSPLSLTSICKGVGQKQGEREIVTSGMCDIESR